MDALGTRVVRRRSRSPTFCLFFVEQLRGTLQQTGVYVYIASFTDSAGKLYDKKGTFTLIR